MRKSILEQEALFSQFYLLILFPCWQKISHKIYAIAPNQL